MDVDFCWGQESGSRVVFGRNKHSKPPPAKNRVYKIEKFKNKN